VVYILFKRSQRANKSTIFKKNLNFSSPSFLFSGHKESFDACTDLVSVYNKCNYNLQHYASPNYFISNDWPVKKANHLNQLPFVPQTNSDVLKVSYFLSAVLKFLNLAIWPDKTHICKLKIGAKATWEEVMELSELYTLIIKQYPIKTQELLMQCRAFNFYTRDYKKVNFNWLPQITIPAYLIEVLDRIYNLRTGEFKPYSDIDLGLVSCSSFWPNTTFQNLPWPRQKLCRD
jgi:hypothetical protein